MRISDGSDVCSSDLDGVDRCARRIGEHIAEAPVFASDEAVAADQELEVRRCIDAQLTPPGPGVDGVAIAVVDDIVDEAVTLVEIGRASCRERVCQYVLISGVAGTLIKKKISH